NYLTGKFTVKTVAVGVTKTATLTASGGSGQSQTATLTVRPPSVLSLTFAKNHLAPGESTTAKVFLGTAAPSGGVKVALSQTPSFVSMPSSVLVSAGNKSASFAVTGGQTTQNQRVVLTGSTDGGNVSAPLAVVTATGFAVGCWPTFGADDHASNRGVGAGANGDVLWTINLPSTNFGVVGIPPLVGPDGTLFFVDGGKLCAFDGKTGDLEWQSSEADLMPYISLSADGTIYALGKVNGDPVHIRAIDSTSGAVKWTFSGPTVNSQCNIPTLGADGSIYVSWQDPINIGTNLYRIDGILGTVMWSRNVVPAGSNELIGISRGLLMNGMSYWGIGTGAQGTTAQGTTALDQETGAIIWQRHNTTCEMLGNDGNVYAGEYIDDALSNAYVLSALKGDTGVTIWQAGVLAGHRNAIASDGSILDLGEGNLSRLSPSSGDFIWQHSGFSTSTSDISGPSVAGDGSIYITSRTNIYGFSLNNQTLWTTVKSGFGPSIGPDGTLYYTTTTTMFAIASDNAPRHRAARTRP
ncbi:MAG TPA: PQQ-binding-like beta-propeller repeat protein, partial [Fimbriimonas sp.]|nr:PQQ-binding-like beta-propeller repeat protein [Fimbriimonas sp.]